MISVMTFANALLDRAGEKTIKVTHLKLQKLAYYCQGLHLAVYDLPLFSDEFEAWRHGPVVSTLYHEYKKYGEQFIPHEPGKAFFALTPENQGMIDFVLESLGNSGEWALVHSTHDEAPWKGVYVPMAYGGAAITKQSLKSYFDSVLVSKQDEQLAAVMDTYLKSIATTDRVRLPKAVTSEDDFLSWVKNA
ncbi:MAG: SocA family protein [Algicola sp.]|nr:SocA family protein [Algicola sp.]